MTPEDLQKLRVRSFLQLAREEYQVVLDLKDKHRRQAAYFLQQAVEKLLRGILETESIPVGPMHNLRGLAELLPKGDPLFDRFVELDELSPAATRFRYPTPRGSVADFDPGRLDALIAKVASLMNDAAKRMDEFAGR